MRVVGVDPGLTRMGVGVVEEEAGRLSALHFDTITTSPAEETSHRLAQLTQGLEAVMREYRPDAVAVEKVFFKLNARTAVGAIQASGIALAAAARFGARVYEYAPAQVKQAVVGTGSATKDQVAFMVKRILDGVTAKGADATDALAVAITCLNSSKLEDLQRAAQ